MPPFYPARPKPPVGSRINWGHPLSSGLAARFLFNDSHVTNASSLFSAYIRNICNNNAAISGNGTNTAPVWGYIDDIALDFSNGATNWPDLQTDSMTSDLVLSGPCTVMARLKMGSISAYLGIVERIAGAGAGWTIGAVSGSPGLIGMDVGYTTTTEQFAAAFPTHGNFFWFTVVYDGTATATNQKIYLDGVLQSLSLTRDGVGSKLTDVAGGLHIGNAAFNVFGSFSHGTWTGGMSDMAIWRRKLTKQEILWYITDPYAHIYTKRKRKMFGIPTPQQTFQNAALTTGLTWMIVTTRTGQQYVWSDKPLPDPSTYYLGWKEARVKTWGQVRRALSSPIDGQYETTDLTVVLDDEDRLLRQLDEDGKLVNATVAVYVISDEGRRALLLPKTIYRGIIRDTKPQGTLLYALTIKDTFAALFSVTNTEEQIPRRTVGQTDFPNCAVDKVSSSASGYTVNGGVSAGATTVPVTGGVGSFAPGDTFAIGGNTYSVSTSSSASTVGLDPETFIEVSPAVIGGFSGGAAIATGPTHQVAASAGRGVTFCYGHITDQNISGGIDAGDGQGPSLYVGDKVLPDGFTYAEMLWQGHACFSPLGIPIPMLYFWNYALDDLHGVYPDIGDLATETGANGRIVLPGYANWTITNGLGSNTYRDYNGRRYTVYYLRGIFRDWALGLTPAPGILGGVPHAVDGYGCEDVGDGSGTLIQNGLPQYKHIVQNWCPPDSNGYQSGAWLASGTFADDPTLKMIDEHSFDVADNQSKLYVSGGFRGDFIVGANGERITARELIARLNVSFGVQCGFNRETQFFVTMVNTDLSSIVLRDLLTWERDIFSGTWSIESRLRELYTAISYLDTEDHFGRAPGGWRSIDSGVTEDENTSASTAYGKTTSPTVHLYMVRCKNRASDAAEYTRGTDTRAFVVGMLLARYSAVQHLPAWQTGPASFTDELGDTVPITHYEGLSSTGWTERPIRIERTQTDLQEFTEQAEGFDLEPLL